jgi:hypothetical protein
LSHTVFGKRKLRGSMPMVANDRRGIGSWLLISQTAAIFLQLSGK